MQSLRGGQAAQVQPHSRQTGAANVQVPPVVSRRQQGHRHAAQQLWQQYQLPATQQQQQCQQQARPAQALQAGPPEHVDAAGSSKKRLAVFVSGGGSNFKAIHAACLKGTVNAEVVVSSAV